MKKYIIFLLVLFSAMWVRSAADAAIIVGRISSVEGQIYRYMDVDDSWVATNLQSPAGTQDVLLTGDDSKAEIAFPNNQLVRLDEDTEIEILNLDEDIGEFTLHSGLARFYNRSSAGKLLIETVRGTATVEPGSAIDVQADKKSVTVSAVYGEAIFRSYQDGAETVEVISGSTSLEFREESIIAGIGPIDRTWDRWCADREEVLIRNRMVRSEYLPESMQEYAYAMEPYGRWQRIYYRGYYYWAWKPDSVDIGWSPYTTGYWDNWQGSPVWIDYNPWGWATHHHGQWVNMHGAWLWTPYVHVSPVPGVTVVGLNITFGNGYRSYWHPGRVRWIAHNDNIGWLPLAPWETYYGYRQWGPGTFVMRGGASLSINLDLSSHRHINHAVIIPRHQLYNRKPGAINNYNTVKIRNINKTVIVKNYRPMQTAEREMTQRDTVKVARFRNTDRRTIRGEPERKEIRAGKTVRRERGDGRAIQIRRDVQQETTIQNTRQRDSRQTIAASVSSPRTEVTTKERDQARTRELTQTRVETGSRNKVVAQKTTAIRKRETGNREISEKVVSSGQRVRGRNVEKQEKPLQRSSIAASVSSLRTEVTTKDRDQARTRESRQVKVETNSQNRVAAEKTAEIRKRETVAREQIHQETRQSQRQAVLNEGRVQKTDQKNNRKYTKNEQQEENKTEQQISRNADSSREKNISQRRNTDKQGSAREWVSASLNNRRSR